MIKNAKVIVVYDYECPACDHYCKMLSLDPTFGELKRVNAREDSDVLSEITTKGFDIDQGMVVKVDNDLYYADNAIHMLSQMSRRTGLFNRANFWLFRSKPLSKVLYPLLRFFRNVLLKVLRKTKINNLRIRGNDRF